MQHVVEFVQSVTTAMGLSLECRIDETPDGWRVDLEGKGGDVLTRRRGEALNALQQIVASVFRDDVPEGKRLSVDCQRFRHDKDAELRQMALFMAEKASTMKTPQEIGPLNPYERRIVHVAVAEVPGVSSESVGDAFLKTITISARK
jgi:spoIIIJ-associated protein